MVRPLVVLSAALLLVPAAVRAEGVRHQRPHRLPPVSGTLRMAPGDFGASHRVASPPTVVVRRRPVMSPDSVEVVRGGVFPQTVRASTGLSAAERWATGGTGLSGLIGNTGNPYAGEAAWGTADSATTGFSPAPRFASARRGLFTAGAVEAPLTDRYAEPPAYAVAYDMPAYGAGPQMPFYGSGAPSSMSYYSSGSSAGPYGSPGGLGTYRSGSYGYGPRVITLGAREPRWAGRRCTCAPRIITLGRHHRHTAAR